MQVKYMGDLCEPQIDGDAGHDIKAAHSGTLKPKSFMAFTTQVRVAIPKGYHGEIRPRSGLARKGVLPALGTIDSGYRGEIGVVLFNHSDSHVEVCPGDRIAQLVFVKHETPDLKLVEELPTSKRGDGGFGSTGMK